MTIRELEERLGELRSREVALATSRERYVKAIREARASGMTLQAIGDVLGLTKQRVGQMLDKETS